MRRAVALALAVALAGGPVSIAAQQQPTPTFRGGVDLLTVQATVIDGDGHPIHDLQPGDFTVTVEGRPRKVLFARLLRRRLLVGVRRDDRHRHSGAGGR